jgi:hypothetical protein
MCRSLAAMELFLNLVWCSIVAAAAIRFGVWSVGRPARHRYLVALATICVLALLFPIISVTDDLRDDPAVFEETSAVRKMGVIASAHMNDGPIGVVVALAAILAVLICALLPPRSRAVGGAPALRVLDGVFSAASVRPPPVFVR